jgi:hypothetical protein
VLDAASAVLGICYERTYEGEPSIKLESTAIKGREVLKLKPIVEQGILDTTQILLEIFENRMKHSKAGLAYSAHEYMAKGLAELAIAKASENGVKTIGFTGGVACNAILTTIMQRAVEAEGLHFLNRQIQFVSYLRNLDMHRSANKIIVLEKLLEICVVNTRDTGQFNHFIANLTDLFQRGFDVLRGFEELPHGVQLESDFGMWFFMVMTPF